MTTGSLRMAGKATASVEYVHIPYTVYRVTVHGVQPDVRARQTVIWNRSNGSGSENSNARTPIAKGQDGDGLG